MKGVTMYYAYLYEFLQETAGLSRSMMLLFDVLIAAVIFAGVLVLVMTFSKKRRLRFRISLFLGIAGAALFCIPYLIFIT